MSLNGSVTSSGRYQPTVVELLRGHAASRPASRAVGDAEGTLTYAQLWESACQCAGGFAQLGIGPREIVLVMLDNSTDFVVTIAGLNFAGAVSVPTNTAYRGSLLAHAILDSSATAAVVEAHLLDRVVAVGGSRLRTIVVRGEAGAAAVPEGMRTVPLADVLGAEPAAPVQSHPWDPFCIAYTSGTTGPSKGAWLPVACAVQNQGGSQHVLRLHGPDDVFFVVCPMFHVSGLLGGVVGAWLVGAYAFIADRFHASTFWDEADAIGATQAYLIGTMAEFLLRQPATPADSRHSLKKIMMLPLHPAAGAFRERFGVKVSTGYGNTETGCFIICGDEEGLRRRSVGRLREGFEMRLVDEHDLEVGPGEIGEVAVRSQLPWLLTSGYVGNPEATVAAWRNGWFHTGDALRQDADGYYYFFDRFKDAIRRRGENISSFELEREVLAHPDVVECAAVGVASRDLEQDVMIAVVRAEGSELGEEQLLRYLVPRLAYYMVPRYISFVDELPKTPTAKVQKSAIRDMGTVGCWDREAAGIKVGRQTLWLATLWMPVRAPRCWPRSVIMSPPSP